MVESIESCNGFFGGVGVLEAGLFCVEGKKESFLGSTGKSEEALEFCL